MACKCDASGELVDALGGEDFPNGQGFDLTSKHTKLPMTVHELVDEKRCRGASRFAGSMLSFVRSIFG
jgi:hypothetical protein